MGRHKKIIEKPLVEAADLVDKELSDCMNEKWRSATSVMRQRTKGHKFFSLVSHNQNLFDSRSADAFSEGSTQAIKRKLRAQTIQRVPDGEISTQYDKNSIEQVEIEFLFNKKVLTSEYDGKDMMKNLWRTFNASYDYGYGCVRTGFEVDADNDIRISYSLINWNDVYPAPDCDYIEEAEWYIIREYISKSELKALLDCEGNIKDQTYNEDCVRYIVENGIKDGIDPDSNPLADTMSSVMPIESVEVWTLYKRGSDTFTTFVPALQAKLREVDNYDPRKDVPIHFMILEPDPDWPLGCSSIMWTLSQQQFADAFQSLSYQTLLLAAQPPLIGFGNLTPSTIKMKPRAFWNMGTNPNNKIEKFPVETVTLNQYGSILQNVSANMMKNLNVTDATVASDAHTMNYSATAQGVQAQQHDKTITVNQYQKRVEIFFAEWANHALRSYINAMAGVQSLTVDEKTRRKIWDIEKTMHTIDGVEEEYESIVHGDKIDIDFDALSYDMLSFEVRSGSLIQNQKESERKNIQELIVPLSQMLGNLTEENRKPFEQNIMQLTQRLCELSDVDIPMQTSSRIDDQLISLALQATMEKQMQMEQQMQQMMQQMMPQQPEMEGTSQENIPPEGMPPEMGGMPPEMGGMPPEMAGGQDLPPKMTMAPQAPEVAAPMPSM